MEYIVKISYYDDGVMESKSFQKKIKTFEELKQAFLKRFGNISDVSNKLFNEKALVKELTYSAKDLFSWVESINSRTQWKLEVREV